MEQLRTHESGPHVSQVREQFRELVEHLRRDAALMREPQAAALFETAAEVLVGLDRAFEHFTQRTEAGWKR
jgi:hypothetical protein